jgi:hypothetical protein
MKNYGTREGNMSHVSWDTVRRAKAEAQNPPTEMITWVQGYILALQDMLKDLSVQREAVRYGYDPDALVVMDMIKEHFETTLNGANRTLKELRHQGGEHERPHQVD